MAADTETIENRLKSLMLSERRQAGNPKSLSVAVLSSLLIVISGTFLTPPSFAEALMRESDFEF
jgi:hypothetical protein